MSLDDSSLLFVVGCPRSGTTWVQLLLAQHESVYTTQETHLFSTYLGPLYRKWEEEKTSASPIGLHVVLDDDAFLAQLRAFADAALHRIVAESTKSPCVILEKTPHHVETASLILRLFPKARFLHVIRDPRAVTASLIAASADWAKSWAPAGAVPAAQYWNRMVGRVAPSGRRRTGTGRSDMKT